MPWHGYLFAVWMQYVVPSNFARHPCIQSAINNKQQWSQGIDDEYILKLLEMCMQNA